MGSPFTIDLALFYVPVQASNNLQSVTGNLRESKPPYYTRRVKYSGPWTVDVEQVGGTVTARCAARGHAGVSIHVMPLFVENRKARIMIVRKGAALVTADY